MVFHLFFALTVSIRSWVLFPTLCGSINTKSMLITLHIIKPTSPKTNRDILETFLQLLKYTKTNEDTYYNPQRAIKLQSKLSSRDALPKWNMSDAKLTTVAGVSAANHFEAFYDILDRNGEVPFFCLSRTPLGPNPIWILKHRLFFRSL
jgi:hypothetical protein